MEIIKSAAKHQAQSSKKPRLPPSTTLLGGERGLWGTLRHIVTLLWHFVLLPLKKHKHTQHTHWHFGNFQYTMDLKILFHQLPKQPPPCCMQRETGGRRGGRRMNRQFSQSWLHMSNPFMVLMRLMVRLCRLSASSTTSSSSVFDSRAHGHRLMDAH